jgi:hypothetical protein
LTYCIPTEEKRFFSATLFLKGPIMEEGMGDPVSCLRKMMPEADPAPITVAPRQVHGTHIIIASDDQCLPNRPEADGIFLDRNDLFISLRFADCFPVIISSISPHPWLMALHSGFAGTLKNIVKEGLSFLLDRFGESCLSGATAWIGPGIGPCCYSRNINDPCTLEVEKTFPAECITGQIEDYLYLDLGRVIRIQLEESGFPVENIFRYKGCTSCSNQPFYSYRKDRTLCRMMLLCRLTDPYHFSPYWWENN